MNIRQVKRLANKILVAAVLFTQAVFLLMPTSFSFAAGTIMLNWVTIPSSPVNGVVKLTVYSNYYGAAVNFLIDGPQTQNLTASMNTAGSNIYSADWITTALPAGNYSIRAEARLSSLPGETASTSPVALFIGQSNEDNMAPSAPTSLVVPSFDYNFVNLSWQPSSDNKGVVHYEIWRRSSGTWTMIGQSTSNAYTDTSITAGSSYYYKIIALDGAGNYSGPSNELFLNIPSSAAPNQPTNLVAVQSGQSIMVSWNNSAGANHYAVQRKINNGSYISLTTSTTVNYYTDSNVTIGSNYTYRVYACSNASCSPFPSISNDVLFSTTTSPPTPSINAPSNLTATVNGSTVTLNWSDNSDNENGFKIYRGPVWTDIGNVDGNVTTKTYENHSSGTYKYKVQAFIYASSSPIYSATSNETPDVVVGSSTVATSTSQASATTTASSYWIEFYEAPSMLSTSSKIYARSNILNDQVNFAVQNHSSFIGEFQTSLTSGGYYYYAFRWDIAGFINNTYQLKVFGKKDSTYFNSQYIPIQILKPVTNFDLNKTTSSTASTSVNLISTTTIIKQPASINISQPANGANLSGWTKLVASSYGPIRSVQIIKTNSAGLSDNLGSAHLNSSGYQWEFGWDTTTANDGYYVLEAIALDELNYKINSNKITVKISNTATINIVKASTTPEKTTETNIAPTAPIVEPIKADTTASATQAGSKTVESINQSGGTDLLPKTTQNIEEILKTAPPYVDPRCLAAGINDKLKCDNFLATVKQLETKQIISEQSFPAECQNANITNASECELFMRSEYLTFECKQAGLTTKEKCREFMQSRFGQPAACSGLSSLACQKLISQVILADFMDQGTIDKANEEATGIGGKYLEIKQSDIPETKSQITVKEDTPTLSKIDVAFDSEKIRTIEKILPFSKSEKQLNLLILPSTEDAEKSKILVSANALIDSDADGLTDDIESRLGTDKLNGDSDQDGYSDGVEVRSNHNPLGAGELTTTLKPIELAIINKARLEQPRLSGEVRPDLMRIQKITNSQATSSDNKVALKNELKIRGRAMPNDVVSLYIYSVMPIVVTVATDENGNWTYNLDKSLTDGKHEAYVVINDEVGKVKAKSAPFSFFIKEAQAVSQNEFLGADFAVPDRTSEFTSWYISGSLLLILLGLGGYLLYQKKKNIQLV